MPQNNEKPLDRETFLNYDFWGFFRKRRKIVGSFLKILDSHWESDVLCQQSVRIVQKLFFFRYTWHTTFIILNVFCKFVAFRMKIELFLDFKRIIRPYQRKGGVSVRKIHKKISHLHQPVPLSGTVGASVKRCCV